MPYLYSIGCSAVPLYAKMRCRSSIILPRIVATAVSDHIRRIYTAKKYLCENLHISFNTNSRAALSFLDISPNNIILNLICMCVCVFVSVPQDPRALFPANGKKAYADILHEAFSLLINVMQPLYEPIKSGYKHENLLLANTFGMVIKGTGQPKDMGKVNHQTMLAVEQFLSGVIVV